MNIEDLLNSYFEGETSAADEQALRRYFASPDVAEHLEPYRPLFAYFDREIASATDPAEAIWQELAIATPAPRRHRLSRRSALYLASAVAASVLAFFTVGRLFFPADTCFCSDNYVVINGRCYTDIHKVRSLAFDALHELATPADAYFPVEDGPSDDRRIIDNQLKELGSIFNDNE